MSILNKYSSLHFSVVFHILFSLAMNHPIFHRVVPVKTKGTWPPFLKLFPIWFRTSKSFRKANTRENCGEKNYHCFLCTFCNTLPGMDKTPCLWNINNKGKIKIAKVSNTKISSFYAKHFQLLVSVSLNYRCEDFPVLNLRPVFLKCWWILSSIRTQKKRHCKNTNLTVFLEVYSSYQQRNI